MKLLVVWVIFVTILLSPEFLFSAIRRASSGSLASASGQSRRGFSEEASTLQSDFLEETYVRFSYIKLKSGHCVAIADHEELKVLSLWSFFEIGDLIFPDSGKGFSCSIDNNVIKIEWSAFKGEWLILGDWPIQDCVEPRDSKKLYTFKSKSAGLQRRSSKESKDQETGPFGFSDDPYFLDDVFGFD